MKKTILKSLGLLMVSAIFSFVVLLCFFQQAWNLIIKETTYAIFTGCIFAIPGTFIVLIADKVANNRKEYYIAYNLKEILQQLSEDLPDNSVLLSATSKFSPTIAEQYYSQFLTFYNQLHEMAIKYLFFDETHTKVLNQMQGNVFDIVGILSNLKSDSQSDKQLSTDVYAKLRNKVESGLDIAQKLLDEVS